MSACERFEILLSGYRDGELGSVSRWRVERHLAVCPDCVRALKTLEKVGACVKENEALSGHPDLWDKIRISLPALDAEIEAQNASFWQRIRATLQKPALANFSPLLVGSAALFLLAIVTFKLQPQTQVQIHVARLPASVETKVPRANWTDRDAAIVQPAQTSVPHRNIQSLNARGHSVVLMQDNPSTTIIWIMDSAEDADGTQGRNTIHVRSGQESRNALGELL